MLHCADYDTADSASHFGFLLDVSLTATRWCCSPAQTHKPTAPPVQLPEETCQSVIHSFIENLCEPVNENSPELAIKLIQIINNSLMNNWHFLFFFFHATNGAIGEWLGYYAWHFTSDHKPAKQSLIQMWLDYELGSYLITLTFNTTVLV